MALAGVDILAAHAEMFAVGGDIEEVVRDLLGVAGILARRRNHDQAPFGIGRHYLAHLFDLPGIGHRASAEFRYDNTAHNLFRSFAS